MKIGLKNEITELNTRTLIFFFIYLYSYLKYQHIGIINASIWYITYDTIPILNNHFAFVR